jgi:hypothetical protein
MKTINRNKGIKMTSNVTDLELMRLGKAVVEGWCFSNLTFNSSPKQRHSVYVRTPCIDGRIHEETWTCHKVNANIIDGWVDALLDEAKIPK